MDYLYKLVTTKNVEINYDAFKKKELVECLATMRDIYFRLQQENQKYKEIIDKIRKEINDEYSIMGVKIVENHILEDILKEV